MSAIDDFIARCTTAVATETDAAATKEVVDRALRDQAVAKELPLEAGVRILHGSEDLTILHVVMAGRPADAGNPIPHTHGMWALIGVTYGSEHNQVFQRAGGTIALSTEHLVEAGSAFYLEDGAIHSVKNPSANHLSSALHVYGGDLVGTEKSMWCEPDLGEEAFDFFRVIGS